MAAGDALFKVVRYIGMAALPDAYSDLFAAANSVFLTEPWFRNFAATVAQDDGKLCFYGVEQAVSGRPVAVLPLWSLPGGRLSPRRLHGLANYYSARFGLVGAAGCDLESVCFALAGALWRDRGCWDIVDMKPVDRQSSWFGPLERALRAAGAVTETYFCHGNWVLKVAGRSYAEYLAGLGSVLRKNIPYNTRRLERSGGRVELITGGGPELERAIEHYERVYRASWKVPEPYPGFMPGLIRTAAQQGWLRMGLASVDNEPAAAQVWLVHRDTASIFKIAYDERFAKLSAGTVLTAHLMNHVLTVDRVSIVDYLSGDDDYKRAWMSERRERHGLMAINPRSVRGAVQLARHFGGALRRRVLQARTASAEALEK